MTIIAPTAADTPAPTYIELTEEEFTAQYTVIVADGSDGWEGEAVRPTDEGLDRNSKHLWTVVEGDHGNLYITSGWARVNSIGYVLTEEAWSIDTSAEWMIFADSDEDDDEPGDFDND